MKSIFITHKDKRPKKFKSYVDPKAFDPTPPAPKLKFYQKPIFIKSLITLLAIVLIVYILLFSSLFQIKNISIKGDISNESKQVVESLYKRNIFLLGNKRTSEEILDKQPGIKEIKILRGLPNSIIVELVERDPALVWITNEISYLVDSEGYLYKQGNSIYIKVTDAKNLPVKKGDRVVSPDFINYATNIDKEVSRNLGYELDNIIVPESTFQIDLILKNGPKIKIDTTRSLINQLLDAKYLLDKNKDKIKEVVDVRVEGFGYIK